MEKILEKIKIIESVKILESVSKDSYEFWYTSDALKIKGFILFPQKKLNINPVIIVNRGGTGDYGKITIEYLKFLEFFTRTGYIVICSQYRGSDGGQGKDRMGGDDIFDILRLYEILKELPCADLNRIGMYGVSRGGMMTFQSLIRVEWIKAAVVLAPPVDEFDMAKWRKDWDEHQKDTYGASDIEKYKRSALSWPEKFPKVPLLIFHGLLDTVTNPQKSVELYTKLKECGVPVFLDIIPDGNHLISKITSKKTIEWLDKYL